MMYVSCNTMFIIVNGGIYNILMQSMLKKQKSVNFPYKLIEYEYRMMRQ